MDQASYKDFKTTRGLNYHYYAHKGDEGKPTILLNHGFPSTSDDWHHQVEFFVKEGYSVIAPDLLGYGGTDKPAEVESYKMSLMCKDIAEILDKENAQKTIAIGHDWGSGLTSRLVQYFPDRLIACAFLATGYAPPSPTGTYDIDKAIEVNRATFGSDLFGYQKFFVEDGADKTIAEHFDAFFSAVFPHDPELFRTVLSPVGAFKEWCLADKTGPLPTYLTEEDKLKRKELLLKDGLAGGLNWYKSLIHGVLPADDTQIPEDRRVVKIPVFQGLALRDYICLPAIAQYTLKACLRAKQVEFDTDHWIPISAPEKLNEELMTWIKEEKLA